MSIVGLRLQSLALDLAKLPQYCASCGTKFTVEHSFTCPKGGFPSIRHNEIHDLAAEISVIRLQLNNQSQVSNSS